MGLGAILTMVLACYLIIALVLGVSVFAAALKAKRNCGRRSRRFTGLPAG